jgi:hypothetical protein
MSNFFTCPNCGREYNNYVDSRGICPWCKQHRELIGALQPQQPYVSPEGASEPYNEKAALFVWILVIAGICWLLHSWILFFIIVGLIAFFLCIPEK